MTAGAEQCKDRLLEWLRGAAAGGWLPGEEVESLESLETAGADRLFEADHGRPLLVGLFGGTGVGKSSLLNRLVGDEAAAVGLERPTSTEVILYVHRDYPVRRLGELFPVDRVRVLEHQRSEYRDVVWIDMPDIDSVERRNRELVFEWLPCIDWLVYVVSPERYRDDAGWRVLKDRGHRHHWLFAMNRWDAGTREQYEDFRRILDSEGFGDSLLARTSCIAPENDDFERMVAAISDAVAVHGVQRLQEVGERARLRGLHHRCERYREMLGGTAQWRAFIQRGRSAIEEKMSELARYLRDEAAIEAAHVPDRPSGDGGRAAHVPATPGRVPDCIEDIDAAVAVSLGGLPAGPVREGTRLVFASLPGRVENVFRRGFRDGAARPGSAVQRGAAALLGKLVYGVPLIACAGIAYVVLTRYEQGLGGSGPFLGFDFLAHSLMVLGLAALGPYLLARLLRPSVRRSIVKRVEAGLREVRGETVKEWLAAMEELHDRRRELDRSLDAIRADIGDGR